MSQMMGPKRKHWAPCNYRALIPQKTPGYPTRKGALLHTEPELGSLLQALAPAQERNPNPSKGTKETSGKMGGWWALQSFTPTAQQGSYGVVQLFLIDTGGWERGKGRRFLTKIREKRSGSCLPVGPSITFRYRNSLVLCAQQHNHEHCPAAIESCDVAPDWFRPFCCHVLSTDISWQTGKGIMSVKMLWVLQTLKQHTGER